MAKIELSEKDLEKINGGVTINVFGTTVNITPDTIQEAWENGSGEGYLSTIQTLGKFYKSQIKQLYAEYADPKTNPHGYIMPAELDKILRNL